MRRCSRIKSIQEQRELPACGCLHSAPKQCARALRGGAWHAQHLLKRDRDAATRRSVAPRAACACTTAADP